MSEKMFDFVLAKSKKAEDKPSYSWDLTKTSIYLRPLLAPKYRTDYVKTNYFNTYCDEQALLYTVFVNRSVSEEKFNENQFEKVINKLCFDEHFESKIENDTFTIICSRIPEQYLEDFYKVYGTKYSTVSKEFKTRVKVFYSDNQGVVLYIDYRLNPTPEQYKKLAEQLGVPESMIKEVGEVESFFNTDLEFYDEEQFKPNGVIYEYINTGGKF